MANKLLLAETLSKIVNESWESWEMLKQVTPVTSELLKFWFDDAYMLSREINFHEWQKQAILNTIYCHEVLKVTDVADMYDKVWEWLLLEDEIGLEYLEARKFQIPRYCMKMATGTGKTWVLEALVIWQYLNAKAKNQWFTKNFMVVAPWLIVYDRLKDAFLWKVNDDWDREFETSDFKKNENTFIPDHLRESMYSFLQSSIVTKDNIWKKITWDGQIILTNWHVFLDKNREQKSEDEYLDPLTNEWAKEVLDSIFPVKPWVAAWNSLDSLDNQALWGGQLEYLKSIPDLIVFNDEAHHLWWNESDEKKWQTALNEIGKNKEFFMQVDFSATPYIQKWKTKTYFPHIIVDFPLIEAVKRWYVKIPVLDKRKEIATLSNEELDFRSLRDESGRVIWLSDWQKVMLEAWLKKLWILEENFKDLEDGKTPKLMIMCEDTTVVPYVAEFLRDKWYSDDDPKNSDFLEIHSNKKWEIWDEERKELKNKLFSIDRHNKPRIIISVLMLREWFDVNNICVIVPLRATSSWILLEQTIWRGLRLMWRWEDYESIKSENRENVLIKKIAPKNYFDILSIVEHPAFIEFYNDLISEWVVWIDDWEIKPWDKTKILWDMISVWLKQWYEEYDIKWPIILNDIEEVLVNPEYSLDNLHSYHYWFEELKRMVPQSEKFYSETIQSWTRFWDYDVTMWIFSAKSYNEFLWKLVSRISKHTNAETVEINKKWFWHNYPSSQINLPQLTGVIDDYLKHKLFNKTINYFEDNNWKVLMIQDVAQFVIKEVTRMVIEAQESEKSWKSEVIFRSMSEVDKLNMRENYSIDVAKCIYPKLQYPSNRGLLEKEFIEFCDSDSLVESFCKINEFKHSFLRFRYIRVDWIPAYYSPDFIVKTAKKIYLVETKWDAAAQADENVKRKKKSAINYVNRINKLEENNREYREREYVILNESRFYAYKNSGWNIDEMLESTKLLEEKRTLFD